MARRRDGHRGVMGSAGAEGSTHCFSPGVTVEKSAGLPSITTVRLDQSPLGFQKVITMSWHGTAGGSGGAAGGGIEGGHSPWQTGQAVVLSDTEYQSPVDR